MDDQSYKRLEDRIDSFVEDEVEAALIKLNPIRDKFIKHGAYGNSRRLVVENTALQDHFKVSVADMARLIFQAAGNDEQAAAILEKGANRLAERIGGHMANARNSAQPDFGPRMQRELMERLAEAVENACTDFTFGVAGGETLKKGTDINLTNIMTNSPFGTQVGGVGSHQHVTSLNLQAAQTAIKDFEDAIRDIPIPEPEMNELRGDLETIKAQLAKPTPSHAIINEAGRSLRNVIEGVVAGVLTPQGIAAGTALLTALGLN